MYTPIIFANQGFSAHSATLGFAKTFVHRMLAKQKTISCHYMCPFSKIFDLISYFLSFIYRIQRNRVCWFCLVWTDDSSIPYPHPRRTVGMCVVKMMKFSAVDFLSRRKILTMPKFAVNIYIFYVSRYFQYIFNFFYFGTGWGWGGYGCFTPPQPP